VFALANGAMPRQEGLLQGVMFKGDVADDGRIGLLSQTTNANTPPVPKVRSEFPETWMWIDDVTEYVRFSIYNIATSAANIQLMLLCVFPVSTC
jgi:hypothetical protein